MQETGLGRERKQFSTSDLDRNDALPQLINHDGDPEPTHGQAPVQVNLATIVVDERSPLAKKSVEARRWFDGSPAESEIVEDAVGLIQALRPNE